MKLIDTHLHFWDLTKNINTWIPKEVDSPFLNKNYLPEDVTNSCSEQLVGVIHIEAHDSAIHTLVEIKWLDQVMQNQSLKFKHIAFVDITLESPQFCSLIDQIREFKQVIGIRHILSHNPKFSYSPCDKDLSHNPNIQANLNYLAQNNLIFDCQMYPYQINNILPAIISSNVTCIIDHLALPAWRDSNDQNHQLWQNLIVKLAQLDNVHIKVSGLDMFQPRKNFDKTIMYCFDNFPIDRLMYGSNYPVSFNDDYNYWFNYLNGLELSQIEKDQLFFKNAANLFFKN